MIRDYHIDDLGLLDPIAGARDFMKINPDWWSYTLENHGVIKAIMSGAETAPGEWVVYCLLSKQFNARDSVELKRFTARAEKVLLPKRVWTISCPDPVVDKWHRYLGFAFEKVQEFRGKQYNMWVRV